MNNIAFEALCEHDTQDIIDYLDHLGYAVTSPHSALGELTEKVEDLGYRVVDREGLFISDQELGTIHALAYAGQREEAIKEILALVVPAITMNTKVLS
jgi:hypothetical protein